MLPSISNLCHILVGDNLHNFLKIENRVMKIVCNITGCPVTDGGTLSLIENLQFWPKKVPKANTNPKHDSI